MLKRNLNEIGLADLEVLVERATLEGLYLDYKAEANVRTDSGRAELIEDIVSFANSFGGDIIFPPWKQPTKAAPRWEVLQR